MDHKAYDEAMSNLYPEDLDHAYTSVAATGILLRDEPDDEEDEEEDDNGDEEDDDNEDGDEGYSE